MRELTVDFLSAHECVHRSDKLSQDHEKPQNLNGEISTATGDLDLSWVQ